MARVLALLPHSADAERLRRALAPRPAASSGYELVFAATSCELLQQARAKPPDLVVFDPDTGVPACDALRACRPTLALLPYGRFDGERARLLLRLSHLGVCEVIIRGQDDDPAAIRARVEKLLAGRFLHEVVTALHDLFPDPLRPLLRHLLIHAGSSLCPEQAARSQFCHSKTLRERLRRAGLPPLNQLIVWTRLFRVAHLLGTGQTVPQAARVLGYPSAAALRVQLHRYSGLSVRDLRCPEGNERLLARFRAAQHPPA
jgi:AraC-like DNA-binding protein